MKKNRLMKSLVFFLMISASGCGTSKKNKFEKAEQKDVEATAVRALEDQRPDKAIKILEDALDTDSHNNRLISLLSTAYAQLHGVDFILIAIEIGTDSTDTTSEQNAMTKIWPYLPEATTAHINGVQHAIDLLLTIPAKKMRNADYFKLAMLFTIMANLRLKKLDTNHDNSLSISELLSLSSSDAQAVLDTLLQAVDTFATDSGLGDNSSKSTAQIEKIYDDITTSEGSSAAEKIAAYYQQTSS